MRVQWLETTAAQVPADDGWLCAREKATSDSMRFQKRRADWLMGRWAAKHAVAVWLNLPQDPRTLATIEIRPSESGAPEVFVANEPAEVSISLSHRAGVAVCAAAPTDTMLGCDLELIEPRSDAFLSDYFTADERELIAGQSTADRARIGNLLWSAKESALKAMRVGLRIDCHRVEVGSVEGLASQSDDGAWHRLKVAHVGDRVFDGWWQQAGLLLRTMVAFPNSDQPEILCL